MNATLFVANRGEPVARARRTADRLRMRLVGAVARDELVCGWPRLLDDIALCEAGASPYRDPERLARIAAELHADAVWPAWGFLSETVAFARGVEALNMTWIGPPPAALALFGDKQAARSAAVAAGLPTLEQRRIDSLDDCAMVLKELNHFPLLLKGAYGGGGKGQVVVERPADLACGVEAAMRQNRELFGSSTLLVEPFLANPRHVEVQVLADRSGRVLLLGTRDCSSQRRFQKVIEEAPAPGITLPPEVHHGLCRLLGDAGYVTAGTVEFLVAGGRFYFLEVNPRLQVEHPVTEETARVRGEPIDLLEWMMATAQGELLPFGQDEIDCVGHAVEARVYAEDVWSDCLPQTGTLEQVRWPAGKGLRVESALRASGEPLLPRYDPMIGKIIATGTNRHEATQRLDQALLDTQIRGVPSNLALLRGILAHPDFQAARLDTSLVARVTPRAPEHGPDLVLAAAIVAYETCRQELPATETASALGPLPISLRLPGGTRRLQVAKEGPDTYCVDNRRRVVAPMTGERSLLMVDGAGSVNYCDFHVTGTEVTVYNGSHELRARWSAGDGKTAADPHLPPTGGVLCRLLVKPATRVSAGTPLYILESMKMETTVTARWAGRLVSWDVTEGELVERGQSILRFEPDPATGPATEGIDLPEAHPPTPGRVATAVLGYDLSLESARLLPDLHPADRGTVLTACRHVLLLEESLAHRMEASLQGLVAGREPVGTDPTTGALLDRVAAAYGAGDRHELIRRETLFFRFRHARHTIEARREFCYLLLARLPAWDDELAAAAARWYDMVPTPGDEALRDRLLRLISERAPEYYYTLRQPPVARAYWQEWLACLAPHAKLPPAVGDPFDLAQLPRREWLLDRWFKDFACRPLFQRTIPEADLYFFEARRAEEPTRLVALVRIHPFHAPEPHESLPALERAAIECYKLVRRLEQRGYQPNHVFLSVADECVIPWGDDRAAMNHCARVAARIGGFASGLRIDATESFLNLGRGTRLLVVRHAPDVGIVSSPPFPPAERRSEDDPEKWLDSRQQRMGKLTNRERLRLLFDDGVWRAVALPHAQRHRLDVAEGRIAGLPAVVYANDFRRMGGALGEAEGQRLTLAVLYAYFTGQVAVAIHDGAGANVRESAASLVWAGAYFGAVAATSARASQEDFRRWWEGHVLREEMAAGLRQAGVRDFSPQAPLRHLHLHAGAAVGMLVYGPSIAGLSVMVDSPNAYRVLTGSRTVAAVLGEKLSNYQLGGAPVHGRCSGDVDVTVSGEAESLQLTRHLLTGLRPVTGEPRLRCAWQCSRNAAVLFPRQALASVCAPDFFVELRPEFEAAGSVTTALTRLGGVPVVVAALSALSPLAGANAWRKLYHAARTAADWQLPLVLAFSGRPVPHAMEREARREEREFVRLLGRLAPPVLALVYGREALDSSLLDHVDATLLLEDPGIDVTGLDCQLHAERFDDGWARLGDLLSLLQATELRPFRKHPTTPRLPDSTATTYAVRDVLAALLDRDSLVEFWPRDRRAIVCGLATLSGRTVAVVADDPEVDGGAQTRDSLIRFTQFGRMVERWRIPLIQFNDSPAFKPGSQQERAGIQGAGGQSLLEEVLTGIERLAVTLRQSYGGRLIHANLPSLGPPRTGLALAGARLGVMGAAGAATVLYRGDGTDLEAWKLDYEAAHLAAERARESGAVSDLCSLTELRQRLLRWRRNVE